LPPPSCRPEFAHSLTAEGLKAVPNRRGRIPPHIISSGLHKYVPLIVLLVEHGSAKEQNTCRKMADSSDLKLHCGITAKWNIMCIENNWNKVIRRDADALTCLIYQMEITASALGQEVYRKPKPIAFRILSSGCQIVSVCSLRLEHFFTHSFVRSA